MGGNGSYSAVLKQVPQADRTHYEASARIDGHKILVQKRSIHQKNTPLNSNSENPIYLCGRVDKKSGNLQITTIAEYRNHRLVSTVDLEFDTNGNYIGYSRLDKKSSHSHLWEDDKVKNEIGRKSHQESNILPVPQRYMPIIRKIEKYNKEHHKWHKEISQ